MSTLSDRRADPTAAAAAAAHRVLVAFFPANQAALDAQLAQSLAGIPDGQAEAVGVALGRAVAGRILDVRADDGFAVADPFIPLTAGPGVWEPTPPAFAAMGDPQFQNVRPFTLADRGQFLPDPPPELTSRRYTRDFDEVKLLGRDKAPVRTQPGPHGRPDAARPLLGRAHADWLEPHRQHRVGAEGLQPAPDRRLLALLNMAIADGYIVGYYQKRHFAFWRPVTAILKAETDGNPSTSPDPSWLPLRPRRPTPITRRTTP